jgi:hypothetical protein
MTQPTALWLADWLDVRACGGDNWNAKMNAAAAELRRLHAEVNELKRTLALQQQSYEREIQIEVEAEREACAKVCDARCIADGWEGFYADECAAEIRARGQA